MNNHNIKKRRPYTHEDQSSRPVLNDIPQFEPPPQPQPPRQIPGHPSSTFQPFPQPDFDILQQAAAILDVPLDKLLDLRSPQAGNHQRAEQTSLPPRAQFKRPRIDSSTVEPTMLPPRIIAQRDSSRPVLPDKGPVDDQPGETDMAVDRRSFDFIPGTINAVSMPLMEGPRLSGCLANFDCPPCTTYDTTSPAYGHVPPPGQFEYSPRLYRDVKPPTADHQFGEPHAAAPDQTGIFGVPNQMEQSPMNYMPNYPPMQSSRGSLSIQPTTTREEMVYPIESSPMTGFFPGAQTGVHEAGLSGGDAASAVVEVAANTATQGSAGGSELIHVTSTDPASTARTSHEHEPHLQPPIQQPPVVSNAIISRAPPPIVPPPRHGSLVPHGPATPHPQYDPAAYAYGSVLYAPEAPYHPGYDVVWTAGGRPPSAKRGPFKNNADREKTAQTRRIGSCIRCRMQRIRCHIDPNDGKGPCLTCQKVASNKVWRLPCLRYKITDIQLFKPTTQVEGHEWTRRWTEGIIDDIGNWETGDTRLIHVSEGYSADKSVVLEVRQFIPQDGDKLERSWVGHDGKKRSVKIPPFAITNLGKAKTEYETYIDKSIMDAMKSLLGSPAKLLFRTYSVALTRSQSSQVTDKERELLHKTLRLWMAIRLTTKSAIIVGQETLGMPQNIISDSSSPLAGKIPLPPVMGAQIDLILITQIQKSLRKELLELHQDMIQNNKQKTWLTTYLVSFILLHNIALITRHDAEYAKKHGIQRRFARENMVSEYHKGANILLAYWHYCNKNVYPFSNQCKDSDLQTLASMDAGAMQFIHTTKEYVAKQRSEWKRLQDEEDSEQDFYFISQLYEENWKPREELPVGHKVYDAIPPNHHIFHPSMTHVYGH